MKTSLIILLASQTANWSLVAYIFVAIIILIIIGSQGMKIFELIDKMKK